MDWKSLTNSAYAPYSGIREVCEVVGKSGKRYPGVRVENISYPLTIHPDQSAVSQCLSRGDTPEALILPESADIPSHRKTFWKESFNISVTTARSPEPDSWYNPFIAVDETHLPHLRKLLDQAVTPNSDFQVSCLLRISDGRYIPGVNVEYPDWQTGLCAERVAIATAFAFGVSVFDELYVHARKGEFVSPCGACRQVIAEHMPDHPVHMYHGDQTSSTLYSSHLLPYIFTSTELNRS